MKTKLNFDLDVDGKVGCSQLAVLPEIDIWWGTGKTICLSFGWIFWSIEFWFGLVENGK